MGKKEREKKRKLNHHSEFTKSNVTNNNSIHVKNKTKIGSPSLINQMKSKKNINNDSNSKKEKIKNKSPSTNSNAKSSFLAPKGYQYNNKQSILIIGDGDFSFSRAICSTLSKMKGKDEKLNVLCTSYDSHDEVKMKYKNANECLTELKRLQINVKHNVDGTNIAKTLINSEKYERIIFNFPHSGEQRVHINRSLLLDFFKSAKTFIKRTGEIHVSLKIKPPYSNWEIEKQAEDAGLILKNILPFYLNHFPGYFHRTTDPNAKVFEQDFCRTYTFIIDSTKIDK